MFVMVNLDNFWSFFDFDIDLDEGQIDNESLFDYDLEIFDDGNDENDDILFIWKVGILFIKFL